VADIAGVDNDRASRGVENNGVDFMELSWTAT